MLLQKNNILSLLGFTFLIILALSEISFAQSSTNFNNVAFAPSGNKVTSIPIGHAEFCQSRPSECKKNENPIATQTLTQAKWQELLTINSKFNTEIAPVTDKELYGVEEFWTYANGYGDCEEYVLDKRRSLLQLGWNASTLLIAVLRQESGEGHAVLMVRTDRGDLVLDNQESLIKLWADTPYRYLKRQSQAHSGQWVDIDDNRTTIVASK